MKIQQAKPTEQQIVSLARALLPESAFASGGWNDEMNDLTTYRRFTETHQDLIALLSKIHTEHKPYKNLNEILYENKAFSEDEMSKYVFISSRCGCELSRRKETVADEVLAYTNAHLIIDIPGCGSDAFRSTPAYKGSALIRPPFETLNNNLLERNLEERTMIASYLVQQQLMEEGVFAQFARRLFITPVYDYSFRYTGDETQDRESARKAYYSV